MEVAELQSDLRNMVDNPSLSDMCFLCKDGKQVHALRLLLAARSPVMAKLLLNGMAESKMSQIALPDMSAPTLLATLEFLYTGAIVWHKVDTHAASDLLHAARFFLLPSLEQHALLLLALECSPRPQPRSSSSSGSQELLHIPSARLGTLSEDELRALLQATADDQGVRLSFTEYRRIRNVVRWCASQISPQAQRLLSRCMPLADSPYHLFNVSLDKARLAPLQCRVAALRAELSHSLAPWLCMLDLRRVHPQLLAQVIHPLNIFPCQPVLEAFRFLALHAVDMALTAWEHEPGYVVSGEGCAVIHKEEEQERVGVARAARCIRAGRDAVCEWDVVVEEPCTAELQLGICSTSSVWGRGGRDDSLGSSPWGWAVTSLGMLVHHHRRKSYGVGFHNKRCTVRMRVDMRDRCLAFSIDGSDFRIAWNDIPHQVCPAVSMLGPGRVRLQLVTSS